MSSIRTVSSEGDANVTRVQGSLFDDHGAEVAETEQPHDPYEVTRSAAHRLAHEFAITDQEAFDLILAFGSEAGARRVLRQRWWLGEVEMRDEREAA